MSTQVSAASREAYTPVVSGTVYVSTGLPRGGSHFISAIVHGRLNDPSNASLSVYVWR